MTFEINTHIEIDASAQTIWNLLMDFEAYDAWNPFIKNIKGRTQKGEQLQVKIDGMKFEPVVTACIRPHRFSWKGKLLADFVFSGEHIFELITIGEDRCRLLHSEKFRGILLPFMKKQLQNETRKGFMDMNEALKKRAESRNH